MDGIGIARVRTAPRSRRPQARMETQCTGTRRSRWRLSLEKAEAGRGTHKGTLFAYVAGRSDRCVVPEKAPNNCRKAGGGAGGKAADQGELHGTNTRTRPRAGQPCHREYMECGKRRAEIRD